MPSRLAIVAAILSTQACGRVGFDSRSPDDSGSGPIHWWKLDDGSGTLAVDSVGNAQGTLTNGPLWASGRCGSAVVFDGTDDYVHVAVGIGTGAFTITGWMFPRSDASGVMTAFSEEDIGGNTLLTCGRDLVFSNDLVCSSGTCSSPCASTDTTIVVGQWTHFAVIRSGGLLTLYLNGTRSGPANQDGGATRAGGAVFYIGSRDDANDFFDGFIDDVRVYDRALSAAEIAALYSAGC